MGDTDPLALKLNAFTLAYASSQSVILLNTALTGISQNLDEIQLESLAPLAPLVQSVSVDLQVSAVVMALPVKTVWNLA